MVRGLFFSTQTQTIDSSLRCGKLRKIYMDIFISYGKISGDRTGFGLSKDI
jgi:hypothetical protein